MLVEREGGEYNRALLQAACTNHNTRHSACHNHMTLKFVKSTTTDDCDHSKDPSIHFGTLFMLNYKTVLQPRCATVG